MKLFYDWVLERHLDDQDDSPYYTAKQLALDFQYANETIGAIDLAECPYNGYTVEEVESLYLDKSDNTLKNYLTHLVRHNACENALHTFIEEWTKYEKEVMKNGRNDNY